MSVTKTMTGPSAAQPLFITASPRPLFIWHHPPASHCRRRAAIVLCPPLGYEYMSAYRTWRVLAERLTALGFDTVRLDYDGTGNSAGHFEDSGRLDAWIRSIECGIVEARRLSGSDAVALVGLRAGAMLALQAAAARGGVERLVLWSPFGSGHAYVRDLAVHAGLLRQRYESDEVAELGVNVAGFVFTRETVASLERWKTDLITTRPAPDVLLIDHDNRLIDPKVHARLQSLGSRITRIRPAGTAAMLRQAEFASVPEPALDAIVAWFSTWRESPEPAPVPAPPKDTKSTVAVDGEYREWGVRFGPCDRLFGVWAAPAGETPDAPAIILLNTSVEYHVGPSRIYVPLARQWATDGYSVLRFDLGGLGDSVPPVGSAENDSYPEHGLDDVRHAIAFVRRESPNRAVILAGLCSGGWIAFEAARQGLPIDAVVSINPPLYIRDRLAAVSRLAERDAISHYRHSLRDPHKWLKVLRGEASYSDFMQLIVSTLRRRVERRVRGIIRRSPTDGLGGDLRSIADRGIRTMFVFSDGDEGLDYFLSHGAAACVDSRMRKSIQHVVVQGAGHSFRPWAAQLRLREVLMKFVAAHAHTG